MQRHRRLTAWAALLLLAQVASAVAQPYPSRPIRQIVPYASGSAADALARVAGDKLAQVLGQPVVIDSRPGAIRSGLLRPIAMTGAKRAAELPDVPTLAEKGIAGFPAEPWTAFFAPAGTPEPILARLSGGLVEALNDAGVREKLKPVMEVETSTPEALRAMVERDIERYGNLVRDVGMKVE